MSSVSFDLSDVKNISVEFFPCGMRSGLTIEISSGKRALILKLKYK
jgi:hypothetical protein